MVSYYIYKHTLAKSIMLEFWNLQDMFFIGSYGISFAFFDGVILSCRTAGELMRCTLSYDIFGHFIAHLVLEHTINVVTGLFV